MKRACQFVSLALVALVATGCSKSTPQSTFNQFTSAFKSKDYKKAFGCMTPESQDMMLGGLCFAAEMQASMGEKGAGAKEILAKHGVKTEMDPGNADADPEKMMSNMVAGVKNKGACFEELMVWLEKNTDQKDGDGFSFKADEFSGELTDVKEEGDVATATYTGGKAKKSTVMKFKKIDGRWLLDLTSPPNQA
jgi:hypothetical protein